MAKAKVVPFQPPVPDDDDDDHECPKCPPVGAPAWLATFADIATNLMAFFVLILGFAQFDEPSFQKMAGAMRERFGVQVVPGSSGESVIDLQPSPTTEEGTEPGSTPEEESGKADGQTTAEAVAKALGAALENGKIEVQSGENRVVVNLPKAAGPEAADALAQALAKAARTKAEPEPLPEPETAPHLATNPETAGQGEDKGQKTQMAGNDQPVDGDGGKATRGQSGSTAGVDAGGDGAGRAMAVRAEVDSLKLQHRLQPEIGEGLVKVEQRDGKIFLTVGAGGSFASGSADLTEEARAIMAEIAEMTEFPGRTITITGHTDNVPISGGRYEDNVALAAARASSVMRELIASGTVDPSKVSAISKGEFAPVADNETAEGRAQNRRIEIEINYAE